jgi:hypothetical protein
MRTFYILFAFIFLFSCSDNEDSTNETSINFEADLTGKFAPFPIAENPDFIAVSSVNLDDNALVGIVNFRNNLRVFPYNFILQSEVINDTFQGQKYALSYCPITKSSVAFTRDEIFRASGYLYKNNLAPYDEKTETIWSQMLIKGIIGTKKNNRFNTLPVLETTWKTVKMYFPNAKVISGVITASKENPPSDNSDDKNAPNSNQLVYGIIDSSNNINIFKYEDFSDQKTINVTIQSQKFIVYGNSKFNVITAFKVDNFQDYTSLSNDEFPFVLKGKNGTKFTIFGIGTNGNILTKPQFAYVAIWSAWQDFYSSFVFQ